MKNKIQWRHYLVIFLPAFMLFASCAYKERVLPIDLPLSAENRVTINGLHISAISFENQQSAKKAFGFNIRKAGLLPIQLAFQNEGNETVTLIPEQTFLVDTKNRAWPINSLERTYKRVEDYYRVNETFSGAAKPAFLLGAAGAVVGLAVGIVTGEDLGEAAGKGAAIGAAAGAIGGGTDSYQNAKTKINDDLYEKSLENKEILPNQIAYGTLFFPGFPDEARGGSHLKITLSFGDKTQAATIDLSAYLE